MLLPIEEQEAKSRTHHVSRSYTPPKRCFLGRGAIDASIEFFPPCMASPGGP